LDNFVAPNKSIICHANLQIVLETFSHTQQASKYSLSNGAETALTYHPPVRPDQDGVLRKRCRRDGRGRHKPGNHEMGRSAA
ncbi:hypothetical protein CN200_24160, partial [Sinorhizobium meliloti]